MCVVEELGSQKVMFQMQKVHLEKLHSWMTVIYDLLAIVQLFWVNIYSYLIKIVLDFKTLTLLKFITHELQSQSIFCHFRYFNKNNRIWTIFQYIFHRFLHE